MMKIELTKRRFVLDMEQGQNTYIPVTLSQRDLPISFTYYDPLLLIIDRLISPSSRQYFNLKVQLKCMGLNERGYYFRKALEYIGITIEAETDGKEKLFFKPKMLDQDDEI